MRGKKKLVLLVLVANVLFSQSKDDSLKVYTLNPKVTTGTRTEVTQSNLPASVSVLSSTEIERSGEKSIYKLIGDKVPGLFLTERGVLGYGASQGAAGGLSIRGVNKSTDILVLIDGRPQFMGIFGHGFPDNYLSMNADRVEVVRGPASVLYGTNAMGGVINIITKKNKSSGFGVSFNNSYGSYNTLINELGLNYSNDKMSFFASYNHSETEGHRDYTDFNMNSGYVKGSYILNENYNIVADFNMSKFRTYDPGTIYDPVINNWVEISRGSIGFAVNNSYEYFDGGIKYYHNWGENHIYDGWFSTDYNINLLLYQNARFIKNNVTTFGIDYKHYGGEGENLLSPGFSQNFIEGKNSIDEIGFYIMSQHYFSNSFTATAGFRYENNSMYGGVIAPQVGFAYHLNENNTIKGTVSKGYRSPVVRELFLFPVRNADLKPEELWNYEISFLNALTENISLETTFFISDGTNMILQEGAQLKNSGAFTHKGIEFSGKYFISDRLSLHLNYTYLDPNKQTEMNPRHKFYVETAYNFSNFNVSLNLKQISKLYGEDESRLALPDYTLLNCNVSYSPISFLSIYVAGNNLLNQEYQTMYGYVMPKSTYMVGLNINY